MPPLTPPFFLLAYGEQGFYPLVPPKSKVRGQIELLSAYNRVDKARERLDTAIVKKEEGSKFFKLNELEIALFAYYAVSVTLDLEQGRYSFFLLGFRHENM